MLKSIRIERKDLFPENMKIEKIKMGEKIFLGEKTTGFVSDNMRSVLSYVFNLNGNWSITASHLAWLIKNKIEKETGFTIPEDYIREIIQNKEGKILKKVYKMGFYVFEFEVEDIQQNILISEEKVSEEKEIQDFMVGVGKKEKVNVRITAADFPEMPEKIKKITVDGLIKYIGKDERSCNSLSDAISACGCNNCTEKCLGTMHVRKRINEILAKTDLRLFSVQWEDFLKKAKYERKSGCLAQNEKYEDLFFKIWNGLDLEFEVEEEEIFPAPCCKVQKTKIKGTKKEKIKVRIAASDFPEAAKSVKKTIIDGKITYGVRNSYSDYVGFENFSSAIYKFGFHCLETQIKEKLRENDPRLGFVSWDQILEKSGIKTKEEKAKKNKEYYDLFEDLALKIWNGLDLEFEVEEEEIFPAQ